MFPVALNPPHNKVGHCPSNLFWDPEGWAPCKHGDPKRGHNLGDPILPADFGPQRPVVDLGLGQCRKHVE